jgi:ligand-binding sensor domain-containing protein
LPSPRKRPADNLHLAIAAGPDKVLWLGTRGAWFGTGGGVSRLGVDGRWQTYTTADGLADNDVTDIAVGPDGALWFGTGGGASRYQPPR